jgi:hypothetical protein
MSSMTNYFPQQRNTTVDLLKRGTAVGVRLFYFSLIEPTDRPALECEKLYPRKGYTESSITER